MVTYNVVSPLFVDLVGRRGQVLRSLICLLLLEKTRDGLLRGISQHNRGLLVCQIATTTMILIGFFFAHKTCRRKIAYLSSGPTKLFSLPWLMWHQVVAVPGLRVIYLMGGLRLDRFLCRRFFPSEIAYFRSGEKVHVLRCRK